MKHPVGWAVNFQFADVWKGSLENRQQLEELSEQKCKQVWVGLVMEIVRNWKLQVTEWKRNSEVEWRRTRVREVGLAEAKQEAGDKLHKKARNPRSTRRKSSMHE